MADERTRRRFQTELEFVQSLANPLYASNLAFQGVFDDPAFVNYLAYLKYWQEPRYARFLHYPQATAMLDLLQKKSFREALKNEGFAAELQAKLIAQWATHAAPEVPPSPKEEETEPAVLP